MSKQYINVNGVNLHYISKGQGDLMLFLHGFPDFSHIWRHQIDEFSNDFHTVALDLRGYNLSEKPSGLESYEIDVLVEDIRQVIEGLGYSSCTLVVHDWGAGIGWTFAYRYPEYVQKLIAFNGPHPYTFMRELRTNKNQQKASEYMKWFQKQEAQDYMERDNFSGLRKLVIDPGVKKGYLTADDVQAYVNSWENGSVLSMLSYYRNLKIFTEEDLQRKSLFPLEEEVLNIPVQIIWGNQDPTFMPENLDGIEEYVPNISVHRLGEASHAPQHEKPHKVNDVMWNFLNK